MKLRVVALSAMLFFFGVFSLARAQIALPSDYYEINTPADYAAFLTIDQQLTEDYNAVSDTSEHITPTSTTLGWLADYDAANGTDYHTKFDVNSITGVLENEIGPSSHGVTYINYLSASVYEENFVDEAFGDLEPQYPLSILGDLFTEGVQSMYGDMVSSGATDVLSLVTGLPFDTGSAVVDYYSDLNGDKSLYEQVQETTLQDTFAKYFIERGIDGAPADDASQAWSASGIASAFPLAAQSSTAAYYNRLYNTYAQYWVNGGMGKGLPPQFRQDTARRLAGVIVSALSTSNQTSLWGDIWGAISGFFMNIMRVFTPGGQSNEATTTVTGTVAASKASQPTSVPASPPPPTPTTPSPTPQATTKQAPSTSFSKSMAAELLTDDLKQDKTQWTALSVQGIPSGGYTDNAFLFSNTSTDVKLEQEGLITVLPLSSQPSPGVLVYVNFTAAAAPYLTKDSSGAISGIILTQPGAVTVSNISSTTNGSSGWGCSDDVSECYAISYTLNYLTSPFAQVFEQNGTGGFMPYKWSVGSSPKQLTAAAYPDGACWEVIADTDFLSSLETHEGPLKICLGN